MPDYIPHPDQPSSTEIRFFDGTFVKSMCIAKAGTFIPQHAHTYAHVSVLVRGSVRVTTGDSADSCAYRAPCGITIPAGVKHLFQSLEDDTVVLCVHDIGTAEEVSVEAEHHIVGPHGGGLTA